MAELSEKEEKKLSDEKRRKREEEEFDERKAEVVKLFGRDGEVHFEEKIDNKLFPIIPRIVRWIKGCSGFIKVPNYVFVDYNHTFKSEIHFPEYSEYPVMSNDEIVIPFINEGWTRENTKGFLLRDDQLSPLTSSFTKEIAEPSIGKRFSVTPSAHDDVYSPISPRISKDSNQKIVLKIKEKIKESIKK